MGEGAPIPTPKGVLQRLFRRASPKAEPAAALKDKPQEQTASPEFVRQASKALVDGLEVEEKRELEVTYPSGIKAVYALGHEPKAKQNDTFPDRDLVGGMLSDMFSSGSVWRESDLSPAEKKRNKAQQSGSLQI